MRSSDLCFVVDAVDQSGVIMSPNPRVGIRVGTALLGLALCTSLASAQTKVPVDTSSLALTPVASDAVPLSLKQGQVQVIITLADAPLAKAVGANAKRTGVSWSGNRQRAYLAQLNSKQSAVMAQVSATGGKEIARLSKAHNAVIAQVDAQRVAAISQLAGVVRVRPVIDYQLAEMETVPYIGAAFLQANGIDGTGVKVAVLDSGIDYTHANLGGSGSLTDYTACYGTSPSDSRNKTLSPPGCPYPTSKVVGGHDFVGEAWNGAANSPPLAPDPNPIGAPGAGVLPGFPTLDGSHGTHVADIIGGKSVPPNLPHVGVAPGTQLYAVKVCSSVSTACSGVALLEGIEFALDPNGDGDISDAVDVINMSLGSNYGQFEDDLSEASAIASQFGIVVVAAAGNAGDRPYIVSSPSTTPEVISVAQTQVPSALAFPLVINSPASIAGSYPNTATVDWAPVGTGVSSKEVAYVGGGTGFDPGTGCPG